MDETICAISTSLGIGAISIIKVSGNNAIDIVNKIFSKDLSKYHANTINYGKILSKKNIIDEVMVSLMLGPNSFTGEDVVEINTHGGIIATNKVLELLLENGCRLAEPGEFTKRRYLNNKIDLLKAEAVSDLISAKSEKAYKLALNQYEGKLTKKIEELMQKIIEISANIEVNIDYPEYEDEVQITYDLLNENLKYIKKDLDILLEEAKSGKMIKDGINVVLAGKPNVGKSSLLNILINENKAIVTNIPGTTRDIVTGKCIIKGIEFNIFDTAGIRLTTNEVEKIGIEKSFKSIENADLIIFLLDNSKNITQEELELLEKYKNNNLIIFINKDDLEKNLKLEKDNIIYGNTLNEQGIINLKNKIIELFNLEKIDNDDLNYLSNVRHIDAIKKILNIICNIELSIKNSVPIDMIGIDLKECYELLAKLVGKSYNIDLVNELFSKFCLGK